jgi:integrase
VAKTLTVAAVKKYRPSRARREVRDGGAQGLYLVIQPSGARSWCLRFRRPDGAPAKLTLGTVDLSGSELEGKPEIGMPLSLPAARQLAAEVHRRRALGHDVIADYAAEKHRRRVEVEEGAANTFGALVRRFVSEHVQKKTRRPREAARLLGLRYAKGGGDPEVIAGGLADRWADRPIAEITSHDIYSVVDEAKRRGIPGLGCRTEGTSDPRGRTMARTLSKLFSWLVQHRMITSNPCLGMYVPPAPAARERVLTDAEIVKFWAACDTVGEPFSQLFKLLLLTGCRLNEVAGMRRAELSADGETWTIPGVRTKNHRVHVVPLPEMARGVLKRVKPIEGEAGLVFTTNGKTCVSGWSKTKRRLDEAMKIPPWRLHDLRRTAATGMAELGIAPHIVEAALNHVSGARAGVAGTYNRAVYAAEKRAALERWASHVAGLVSGQPAAVTPIRRARSARP